MTNVERYANICRFLADVNPEMSVPDVLSNASNLLAMAGPQPRAPRKVKPTRAPKADKNEAA